MVKKYIVENPFVCTFYMNNTIYFDKRTKDFLQVISAGHFARHATQQTETTGERVCRCLPGGHGSSPCGGCHTAAGSTRRSPSASCLGSSWLCRTAAPRCTKEKTTTTIWINVKKEKRKREKS